MKMTAPQAARSSANLGRQLMNGTNADARQFPLGQFFGQAPADAIVAAKRVAVADNQDRVAVRCRPPWLTPARFL